MISGLYTALSGLHAQRRVLDVTAHNVANEATPGYHRQRVELQPAGVASVAAVFAGTTTSSGGVNVLGVTRVIDEFAEARVIRETAVHAGAKEMASALSRVELVFSEPSDSGLAAVLDDFWSGWSDLSSYPGDLAMRSQVLQRARNVVDVLHRASADLAQIEQSTRLQVERLADEVNVLAAQLAKLNSAIVGSVSAPNDLMDQRDAVLTELAALTGAVARPNDSGAYDVYIGGRAIVSGSFVQPVTGAGGELRWEVDGNAVATPPSRAASLAQTITDVVPRYQSLLDDVATTLMAQVNALHQTGFDQAGNPGEAFFVGTGASTIEVNPTIAGNPAAIAAAGVAGAPLDGEVARQLALLAGAPGGADEVFRSLVTGLGVEVRAAGRRENIQEQVLHSAAVEAASVSGVSIDEEMANLIAAQRAYEASARVLTTVDQLLETLMRTGVVGR